MSSVLTSLAPGEEEGEAVPQATSFCPYCNINLAYPAGSQLIQCPQCNNTLDPNSAHQIRCTGCTTLLAYPANSKYIQCPKCLHTMDPREVGPLGTAGSAVPPVPHHHSTSHAGGGGGAAASTEPKKRRDPNAPKAVCNAYMIFCKSRRGELKNELPELAFGKIGAKLGEMWRNMTSEEKKPYEDRAMVDRERYRKEMVEYTAGRGDHAGGGAHKKSKHEAEVNEDDQKLARDVSQQQHKAAQRARRESAQRRHHHDDDDEDEASGRSYSGEEGEEEEQ